MIQLFIYYLIFLIVFLIIFAAVLTRSKIRRPFRLMVFLSIIIVLPPLVQFLVYTFSQELPTVEVPNLVGMPPAQAQLLLTELNLSLQIKEVIPPPGMAADIILDQFPEAKSKVKTGKTIFVSVSAGPQKVSVPNLIGRPLSQIYVVLQEMELKLGEMLIKSSGEHPNNTVIDQNPAAGESVDPGSSIDITISINPESANE
jgi:serine/threonine-protein kinase